MRGLTYEELAAAYEMRHGYETKTPWKYIARELGVTVTSLYSAIQRLQRDGLNRDADGNKPLTHASRISSDMLEQVHKSRRAGNSWPKIAAALGIKVGTVQCRYWRWQEANKIPRKMAILSRDE